MLKIFLSVCFKFFSQFQVLLIIPGTAESTGNRTYIRLPTFAVNNQMRFRRRTENSKIIKIKIEQIRRRINRAQRSIQHKVISFKLLVESSREHNLRNF